MSPADRGVVLTPVPGEGELGLVDALAQLSFAVQGALGRIAAAHDLSIVQARLLGILRDRRPTINELAGFLGLDKSSVTGLVDRAEDRGLVRRVASRSDGRKVQVAITPAGQKLIGRAAVDFEAEIAALVVDLSTAQRDRLATAASRVVTADARRRGIDLLEFASSVSPLVEREHISKPFIGTYSYQCCMTQIPSALQPILDSGVDSDACEPRAA